MLIELRIKDFAVFEDLMVPLASGLNVVTGETGAGKSIVVDALGLLMGGRASLEVVRSGSDRAIVEGLFDVADQPLALARLSELGLEADDGHLVFRREIAAGGRSRAWINGSPTTATVLRRLAAHLVDIHGQHEHQRLLSPDYQQEVLDAFAGATGLAAGVRDAFAQTGVLQKKVSALEDRRRELERKGDFVRFQLTELRAAQLEDPSEEDELEVELSRLGHAEELAATSRGVHHTLYGADHALSEEIGAALTRVRRLEELDPSLSEVAATLENTYHLVVDVADRLNHYADAVESDPERLEVIRERRALLSGLRRKYGATLAEVIAARDELEKELDELATADLDAGVLSRQLNEARAKLRSEAEELSQARRSAAQRFEERVEPLLPPLGLEGSAFKVRLVAREEASARGLEATEFAVSLNPGFPVAPLARVASGGELSRVMLTLKSVLADLDRVPTLTFDEIDVGIGGVVATQVGDRLRDVADGRQVLVVTHLPQIACRAGHHLLVEKSVEEGVTVTTIQVLGGQQRIDELARMLDGDPASEASLRHARELLEQGVSGPLQEAG